MTREELFEAIGEVGEELVEETRAARERAEQTPADAGAEARSRGKLRRRSRAPVAAGVILAACVAAAVAIPAVRSVLHGNGSAGTATVDAVPEEAPAVMPGEGVDAGDAADNAAGGAALTEAADEASDRAADAAASGSAEQAAEMYDAEAEDEALAAAPLFEFNGCLYEAADDPETLTRFGLPAQITADMAGEHIAWLRSAEGSGYEPAVSQEDASAELLAYAPAPSRGVYVLRDGDRYLAAVFCNFNLTRLGDSNASVELSELFRVYGVEGAEDIALVCETDRNRNEAVGTPVTAPGEIAFLYEELTVRDSWGNDDFQTLTFGGTPEEEQPAAHAAFADDMRMLRIETADGLRFYLEYYPSYGWLYGQGTLSWYRAEGRLAAWLNERFG